MHAWTPPTPISGIGSLLFPVDPVPYERQAKKLLEEAIERESARVGDSSVIVVPTLTRRGPAAGLLEAGKDAQLLVVGTRGRGRLREMLLGSVSQQCALHTTIPIAVVPEGAPVSDDGEVVVGVDGSAGASAALRWAVEEAVARGARLCAVHALDFDLYAGINWKTFSDQSHEMMKHEVEHAIAAAGDSPVAVDRVSSDQAPVEALLDRAGRDGLLVVGSRGGGGFGGLMLGSVSQHCLHYAQCVVVVVPHANEMGSS